MKSMSTDLLLNSQSSSFAASVGIDEVDVDELIAGCLERLIECGPVDDLALLRSMLPDSNAEARQFVLIELIKLDMAMAAESGKIRLIERYSAALPDLLSLAAIPLDLVMEEIQLRKESGEDPSRDDYLRRFPQFEGMLSQLSCASEATSAGRKLAPPPELALGTQIDDFLLLQKLGQGAFAHVYLAQQLSMHRLVALKVSRGKGDESQALAQFDHPNIVRVYDQRELTEQKVHLLYMQFHPGGTLAEVVKCVRGGSDQQRGQAMLQCVDRNLLSSAQAVPDGSAVRNWITSSQWPALVAWLGVQLARALHDAHGRGVLHRDVKPANVLLSAEGIPKLADFNVSFAGAAGRAGAAASFGGSIGYMSPEHLKAIGTRNTGSLGIDALGTDVPKVQESADLFSLAVLLWELWQGNRPFVTDGPSTSWSEATAKQLNARQTALREPRRCGSAAERVLEKVLRSTLSYQPSDRPSDGAELAGRLRLAIHPEAAALFDPGENALRVRALKISPWLIACLVILIPNMVAGYCNYKYNHAEVITKEMPALQAGLDRVSWVVNLTFFPLGSFLIIWLTRGVVCAIRSVRQLGPLSQSDIDDTLDLGHRAALIGGTLWLIAGFVFPAALWWMYPDFTGKQAAELVVSSMICGGVAMIYPFFGMAVVSTLVYYPRLLSGSMQDSKFDERASRMIRRSELYLLIAAIIPLLGAALLVSSQSSSRIFMLTGITAAVLGLLAAAFAYRVIARTWLRMGEVLSTKSSVVPGES